MQTWRRTLRLHRKRNEVELSDRPEFKKPVSEIAWTFMTACPAQLIAPGRIAFTETSFPSGKVALVFDPGSLKSDVEEIPLKDGRLRSAWGKRIFRIRLREQNPPRTSTRQFRFFQE
jgi:hypothetical protein